MRRRAWRLYNVQQNISYYYYTQKQLAMSSQRFASYHYFCCINKYLQLPMKPHSLFIPHLHMFLNTFSFDSCYRG